MNKAIFLDRDGTINIEKNYIYRKEDFEFIPGAIEALRNFKQAGFRLIVITNQSGIARGYYTEEDFQKINSWMQLTLSKQGAEIDKVYYCPHHPDAIYNRYRKECNCRKPKTGLFFQAVKDFNIDLNCSYAIGDRLRDCSICNESECRGFLIGLTESKETIDKIKNNRYPHIRYVDSLLECSSIICQSKINTQ